MNAVDHYNNQTNQGGEPQQFTENPGMIRSFFNGIGSIGSTVWSYLTWCAYPENDDDNDFNHRSSSLSSIFYRYYMERVNALED